MTRLIAVDACTAAGFGRRADHDRVARHGDARAEVLLLAGVAGLEVSLLRPDAAVADEHVSCTAVMRAVVRSIAVDPGCAARLVARSDHDRVAGDRHLLAEVVPRSGVARLEVTLLVAA